MLAKKSLKFSNFFQKQVSSSIIFLHLYIYFSRLEGLLQDFTRGKIGVIRIFDQFKAFIDVIININNGFILIIGIVDFSFSAAFWTPLSMLYRFLYV